MALQEVFATIRQEAATAGLLIHDLARISPRPESNHTCYWDDTSPHQLSRLITDHLNNPQDQERRAIRRILINYRINSVLDCGCGPATEYFGYQTEPKLTHLQYYGIDLSSRMINFAKTRAPRLPLARADIARLPFPDHSFDAVILKHVLEHQRFGYTSVLTEAVRVARTCVIVDFFHALLNPPLPSLRIHDRGGYANHWYSREEFEKFLNRLPLSGWEHSACPGTAGQHADIYTLLKPTPH